MITLANTPVLETERLVLRAPAFGDFEHWAAFSNSDRAKYMGGTSDRNLAWRGICHITGHWVQRGFGSFIFVDKTAPDTPLGMAGPWFPEGWPEQELGWSIWVAQAEGKGFAFEAAVAARRHAYKVLGWTTAVSYVAKENVRSIALAERLGAERDDGAARIDMDDLVYRHPAPEDCA